MNINFPGILAIATLTGLCALAETSQPQPLPAPFPEARYHQMSVKSPFAVATASAAVAAPTPGFATQLYLIGVAHVGPSDFAAIKSRDGDSAGVMYVEVGGTSKDGMKVERVNWSDITGKSTVDVSKMGEKATLIFDEAQIAKNAGPVAALVPGQPGIRMPALPGQPRTGPLPQDPRFQPGAPFNRGGFSQQWQPGQPNGQPNGQVPLGQPPGVNYRRRLQTIPSGQ